MFDVLDRHLYQVTWLAGIAWLMALSETLRGIVY